MKDPKDKQLGCLRKLLGLMIARVRVKDTVARDPVGEMMADVRVEKYSPKVVNALSGWTDLLLRQESIYDQLVGSYLLDDLLLCLAATSARTPAAFENCVQQNYPDLPAAIAREARKNGGFFRRQAAILVLANFRLLTGDTSKSLVSCLLENRFVSGSALKSVLRFAEAESEALQFICECLKSESALQMATICRLLCALTSNTSLSMEKRSFVMETLNTFVKGQRQDEDQPIILFRQESKVFNHPLLSAVAGEALTSVSGIEFDDDSLAVPFQLGQPDDKEEYIYQRSLITSRVSYRYSKVGKCWYWRYWGDRFWMPVSTLVVRKESEYRTKFDSDFRHIIKYLHQVNPEPPSVVLEKMSDWTPDD